jgi:hypothetical protein
MSGFMDILWNMMGAAGAGILIGSADGNLIFDDLVVSVDAVPSDARAIEVHVGAGRANPRPAVVNGGAFRVTVDDDPEEVAQRVMDLLVAHVAPAKRIPKHPRG